MKLADLFKKGTEDMKALEIYSGMRVVVEDLEGQMLFVAKLQDPQKNTARLYQYSATDTFQDTDITSIPVKIRGYNDCERKAVFMEGDISPKEKHIWQMENLIITRIENERAYSRMNTDIDATVTMSDGENTGEKNCRLLNISVGGANIASEYRYYKSDRFILRAQLVEDHPISVMYCEILRVIEKNSSSYEYGCRFLELTEADQEELTQCIELISEKEEPA